MVNIQYIYKPVTSYRICPNLFIKMVELSQKDVVQYVAPYVTYFGISISHW